MGCCLACFKKSTSTGGAGPSSTVVEKFPQNLAFFSSLRISRILQSKVNRSSITKSHIMNKQQERKNERSKADVNWNAMEYNTPSDPKNSSSKIFSFVEQLALPEESQTQEPKLTSLRILSSEPPQLQSKQTSSQKQDAPPVNGSQHQLVASYSKADPTNDGVMSSHRQTATESVLATTLPITSGSSSNQRSSLLSSARHPIIKSSHAAPLEVSSFQALNNGMKPRIPVLVSRQSKQ